MEKLYKVISFVSLIAYSVKAAIMTPSLNDSLIVLGLIALFLVISKYADSENLKKLEQQHEDLKKDMEALTNKVSSLALRNLSNPKSLTGR